MKKKGVLLINLGTPDSPSVKDVRKYLREFLMDKFVIDLPFLSRWMLVHLIIAPFRGPKSAKIYKKLWNENGSPLKYFGYRLKELTQVKLGEDYSVELAMRYQIPSIESVLKQFRNQQISEIIVLPLYPQFASSTTLSSISKVEEELKKINYSPQVKWINNFLTNPKFIQAFSENGNIHWKTGKYQKILFSYHGVPERHIMNDCQNGYCKLNESCCSSYNHNNQLCYRAQCFETSRLIALEMGLTNEQYIVAFQSRLETRSRDPWLKPYADLIIADLPKDGIKNVLAFSPSFVADCLETTIEVGVEFKEIFHENGGEKWQLVESLNESPTWVETIVDLIEKV